MKHEPPRDGCPFHHLDPAQSVYVNTVGASWPVSAQRACVDWHRREDAAKAARVRDTHDLLDVLEKVRAAIRDDPEAWNS